ncbi:ChaB family protein [Paenibacillus polymyxa]|uniref:ChaB family protein n=1 Tax=Paenibacillus polymyxa TaxID=1406 RepID=UPI0021663262|nr:ChaB family protein [Paenibacillus polymyxa]
MLEQAILTGWFLPQSNPMEFYVLDVLNLVVDFGSPEQVTACAHRYIRHLPEEMQDTFRKEYEAYQRDGQAASTIAFRKLIPLMVERNISLPAVK